jgi:hypothetical protein
MMNQLVMQSSNPEKDKEGSTQTKNVATNPIVSRYSAGARLYRKGELKAKTDSENAPAISPEERQRKVQDRVKELEARDTAREAAAKEKEEQLKKKEKLRSETNEDTFLIYYEGTDKKYYLCEKTNDFLNYALRIPDKKATYQNNGIMPSTTLSIDFLGIAGIDYLAQFLIDHAPEDYNYNNAVWQVTDIKQEIIDKMWTTQIVASVRPLSSL